MKLLLPPSSSLSASPTSHHNITAILTFDDSTLDSANNNFIHTLVKVNYTLYCRYFPGHIPTARFSN